MPVAMIFIVFFGFISTLGMTIQYRVETRVNELYEQSFQSELIEVSRAVERYISNEYIAPVTLLALADYTGNAPLKSLNIDRIGVASSRQDDVGLVYSKALVWHKRYDSNYADEDVLENNQIGTSTFSEQGDYKPPKDVYWYQTSSISTLSNLRTRIYKSLDETVQRLVYSSNTLPLTTSAGQNLAPDDTISLVSAVGYVGSFSTCSGVFEFDGAALTCSDLYALDGTPVMYQVLSDSQAAVYVESANLKGSAGDSFLIFSHIMTKAD